MQSTAWLPSAEMTEPERVDVWRAQTLAECGYPTAAALELARRRDVDVHQACTMVARGCDPLVAIDILV